jgi:predicted choloylglycine hydrolase
MIVAFASFFSRDRRFLKKTGAFRMRINFRRLLVLAVLAVVFTAASAAAKVVSIEGAGWREDVDGVRVVHLQGTHYEMGRQHGKLLKEEIHALIKYFFEDKGTLFGASVSDIAKAAATMEKFIPAEYIDEMKGVAEGAGVEYEKVLYSNVFLDVVSAHWVGVAPGCSNFIALPGVTKDGNVVHGRNLDWSADEKIAAMNTVFFYTPNDGIPFAALGWPSIVGTLTGMNARQISMGEMTSMSSEATLEGIPIMILLRMLLETSDNLDSAFKVLADNPRTTGYNVLVSDGKAADAFGVEMSAKNIFRRGPKDGYVFSTNHYTNKKLKATQERYLYMFGNGKKSDTFYRYDRFDQLLKENRGKIDPATAMSIMGDKFDPLTNSVSGDLTNTICAANTLQSVIMLPQSGELYVAIKALPAPDGGYVKLKFIPDRKPPAE